MRKLRLMTVALSATLAVALIGCGSGGDKKGGDGKGGDGNAKGAPAKPDLVVTAEDMAKEFLADEKKAEAKHKDKVVEITGPVVQLIFDDSAVVNLKGAKKDEKDVLGVSFNCGLQPAHRDAGTRLNKGQKVQLVGKYQAKFGSVINLYDCTLKEVEPSTILDVTAEALAEEFQKNPKAAHEKYKDQWVLITGEVTDLPTKGDFYYATLKGKSPVNIRVTLAVSAQKKLKKGETVTLHAEGTFPELDKNEVGFDAGFIASTKK